MQTTRQKVLIFGGTIFLGKCFLTYLKNNNLQYEIHCLNRGTPYWNDAVRKEHPEVIHHHFDRNQPQNARKAIKDLNSKLGISLTNKWRAVIDFTVFQEIHLQSLYELQGLTQRYLMISTDSVYNNSTDLPSQVKEADLNLQQEYNKIIKNGHINDEYGLNKMKCEINLKKMAIKPYICLRLPDIIGQFDVDCGSQRFWCTLTWIRESQKCQIPIDQKFKEKKLSFIDSYDLARTLNQLICSEKMPPHNQYNLSFRQTPTLSEFYQHIAEAIQIKATYYESKQKVNQLYPSVQFGTIDCSRAEEQIGWNPTPLAQSIRRIAKFYMESAPAFQRQYQMMRQQLRNCQAQLQPQH